MSKVRNVGLFAKEGPPTYFLSPFKISPNIFSLIISKEKWITLCTLDGDQVRIVKHVDTTSTCKKQGEGEDHRVDLEHGNGSVMVCTILRVSA